MIELSLLIFKVQLSLMKPDDGCGESDRLFFIHPEVLLV